jgi:drug/metabolite transporter (DMT)-like permease
MNAATLIGGTAVVMWATLASLAVATGELPPFEVTAIALGLGACVGLAITAVRGRLRLLVQPWPVYGVGIAGIFLYHALYFAAVRNAPPAEASLVAYLWPLLIVLLSALLPGERLTVWHVIGGLLGFAGAAVLILGKSSGERMAGAWLGDLMALACAFTWSTYSVMSRRMKAAPTEVVAGYCAISALLAFVCHRLFETTAWPGGPLAWAAIVTLGVFPLGLGFYTWDYGVKNGDIQMLGVASYGAPLGSTVLLVLLGFAAPTGALAIAAALIVGGAVVSARSRVPKRKGAGERPTPDYSR